MIPRHRGLGIPQAPGFLFRRDFLVIHNDFSGMFSFFGLFFRAFFLPLLFVSGVWSFFFDILPNIWTIPRRDALFLVLFYLTLLLAIVLAIFFCLPQEVSAFQQLFPEVDISWLTT